jgi:hypothetical protein
MFGALDLLPKDKIAGFAEIRHRTIEFAGQAEIAGTLFNGPIAGKVLAVGAVMCARLRDHRHLMRIKGERCLAALAKVIFEIDALPAIRAPELTHEGVRRKRSCCSAQRS